MSRGSSSQLLRVLRILVWLTVAVAAVQVATAVGGEGPDVGLALANAAACAVFAALPRLARRGHESAAAMGAVAALALVALALLVLGGANDPTWAAVSALAAATAGILLRPRQAAAAVALSGLVVLPIAVLETAGVVGPAHASRVPADADDVLVVLVVLACAALVAMLQPRQAPVVEHPERPSLARRRTLELTNREIEVVRLVADGLSNNDIADRLYLSPRTVQAHVANAVRKTESSNRTDLSVLAVREGVVALDPRMSTAAPVAFEGERDVRSGGRA